MANQEHIDGLKSIPAALHEAGHATACLALRRRLRLVRISARNGTGQTLCGQHPRLVPGGKGSKVRVERNLRREIIIIWCGILAEASINRQSMKTALLARSHDANMMLVLLAKLAQGKAEQIALGRDLRLRALELLTAHRKVATAIALALIRQGMLTEAECRAIWRKHLKKRPNRA